MNRPTINWEKVKSEVIRLSNTDELKKELQRLLTEIKKFDIHSHLSPSAKSRLNDLERRYNLLVNNVNRAQRQFDREFNKVLRVLRKGKVDAEKTFKSVQKTAKQQQKKFKKVSTRLRKKVTKKSGSGGSRKRASS